MTTPTTVLGYPRIGPRRELKRAVERYWAGDTDAGTLDDQARTLRAQTWQEMAGAGLSWLPGNTFSYYDHVLDTAAMVGALPDRVRDLGLAPVDAMFAAARGTDDVAPLEMTKWFDTNYHYLVPELGPHTKFGLDPTAVLADLTEARAAGFETRPVLLGPVTFLLLAKPTVAGFHPLHLLEPLVEVYADLLARLHAAGAQWVQLDEPAFAADRSPEELAALHTAYSRLGRLPGRPRILVAGYFGDLGAAVATLAGAPVEGLALDLVSASPSVLADVSGLGDKTLVAGVVDGRNVWRTDLAAALATLEDLTPRVGELVVSSSCSLLHVPYDVDAEVDLDPAVRERLAFARQKVAEIVRLGGALDGRRDAAWADATRPLPPPATDEVVRARARAVDTADRTRAPWSVRKAAQRAALDLPALPTTTIGSFPQTPAIRRARADLQAGRIGTAEYDERMRAEIAQVIALQVALDLDVLVHGEPERNDMVQYFAEHLTGFAATRAGWVQSYGTRCVRPPILHGDVSRPEPITVPWAAHAQSLTDRPVKGMLTGPVTILAWSFVREDQPLAETATQVALALREEVSDLEAAGIRIVQVDEPALRELLPLRRRDQGAYLRWSVEAFRLATGGAAPATQVHTHLCYSEFGEVMAAIDSLDADVTTIEAARSSMELIGDIAAARFDRELGPGVYDIHSLRVPSTEEVADLLRAALPAVPPDRLWVNPDCGLKTRDYAQVGPALTHLVAAAHQVRAELS